MFIIKLWLVSAEVIDLGSGFQDVFSAYEGFLFYFLGIFVSTCLQYITITFLGGVAT